MSPPYLTWNIFCISSPPGAVLLDLGTDLTPLPAVCMELGKEIKLCLKNVHGKEGSFGRGAGIYGVIF